MTRLHMRGGGGGAQPGVMEGLKRRERKEREGRRERRTRSGGERGGVEACTNEPQKRERECERKLTFKG